MIDGIIQFFASVGLYFVIFAGVGILFKLADRRLRISLDGRSEPCRSCGKPVGAGDQQRGRCPSCGRRLSAAGGR